MKDIKIAAFSDIHLGHKSNDTLSILKMLDHYIFKEKLIDEIDLLIFVGDTFDRLLDLSYPALADIDAWFAKLLRACESRGVLFRVLEGTPSHDRGQPERINTIYKIIHSQADFAYVDNLKIEYIEKFDMNVLYIPDEWRSDVNETLSEVKEHLKAKGLSAVDIALMHGQFEYQLPFKFKGIPIHDANEYSKIVDKLIFIGHVHTHSRSGKIVAQGSLDRLRHGEEEPKGFLKAEIKNNRAQVVFIENKLARLYKTIKVYGLAMSDVYTKIEKVLKGAPMDICVRIEAEHTHPVFTHLVELQRTYPTVTWSKLPKDEATGEEINIIINNEFDGWSNIDINQNNIIDLVIDRMKQKDFNDDEINFTISQMQEVI